MDCLVKTQTTWFGSTQTWTVVGLANPASVYCIQQSGTLEIITDVSGAQAGMCHLSGGVVCDEWAYFRGECPATGLTEADLFVNPNFCSSKQTRQEILDWYHTDCQSSSTCVAVEKEISDSAIVFPDRTCQQSWFKINFINTNNLSGNQTIVAQSMQEIRTLGKLPEILYTKLLKTEIGFNEWFLSDTVELTGIQITGADISRAFISFIWQEHPMLPVFNLVIQKGGFIVTIQNPLFNDPSIASLIQAYEKAPFTTPQSEINNFNQLVFSDSIFQTLLQNTISATLSLFTLK